MKTLLTILAVPGVSALMVGAFLAIPAREFPDVGVAKAEPKEVISLVFVGDMMLDRQIRQVLAARGPEHVFGGVAELITSADIAAGNLEGPITDGSSVSWGTAVGDMNNMRFTFPTTTPVTLLAQGFDLVSIGNNHINDFGTTGVESTKRFLREAGLSFVGDPLRTADEPVFKEVRGVSVAFVAYNQFYGSDPQPTLQAIREARRKEADAIVVMAHWGEEYTPDPTMEQRELARQMSDAGADLVIGTHSHVIGLSEDIGKTRVYYSLGNFIFDQYFSPEVKCGLAVRASVTDGGGMTFDEVRVGMLSDGRTVLECAT